MPKQENMSAEAVVRASTSLPTALFAGAVSVPLNEEAKMLVTELDPKMAKIRNDVAATLELCHDGNKPDVEKLDQDIKSLKRETQLIQEIVVGVLSGAVTR
ncbi:unnamed protein product [Choristocarpus tenellus]